MNPTLGLLRQLAQKPTPLPTPSGEAFALVRRMLQERPRHFREILADGIATSTPEGEEKPVAYKMKKVKGKGKDEVEPVAVPEGHPFLSAGYLKNRIIPVLESQRLVRKAWLDATPGTSLARMSHHQRKHAMWVIQEEGKLAARWEAITDPALDQAGLRRLGGQERLSREAAARSRRETAFTTGREERTERDIMAWADRPAGFTTNLERKHLNTRRNRARPVKEARVAERAAMRAEVATAVQADLKVQGKIANRAARVAAAAIERREAVNEEAAVQVKDRKTLQAEKEAKQQRAARRRKEQRATALKANRQAAKKAEVGDKVQA
ncbi:hypothetical protein CcaverHIS002_0508610 [Cutaneotrichosporon cavernicola]|uniref:Uncharacterized protein n=1 Tax=Cutaneotrichosporon cavernicola TaxID=279322 RepID=A0AA48L790_9TREE|nr:uncharacterized protein CcaverHIS019_0509170 [Cutaneotrichosporon cavernicola]BEI85460.1 hypothetical protein CcaverHIS002_0508610 [Cutaneotrichosporon cavernicola]BEI93289.1 hypothetical protein CcaverHIS019_0509170 [Cutaneotrichosporon cavernicola]BEJ01067.1 hypothetical protein CcaverHIS631_0509240 [Cutaneotrichosporon cavernicola]BEJ08834.1 hypothetical protein CcaverHIS641_0509280 [Cutaneotrichosporon cavernicola]